MTSAATWPGNRGRRLARRSAPVSPPPPPLCSRNAVALAVSHGALGAITGCGHGGQEYREDRDSSEGRNCPFGLRPALFRQELRHARVEEAHEAAIPATRRRNAVAPIGGVGPKGGVGHFLGLDGVVFGREIQIGLAGNKNRPGPDGSERAIEISLIAGIGADIALLPGPELCQ